MVSSSLILLPLLQLLVPASPRPQIGVGDSEGPAPTLGYHDALRWVWIDASSLALEWPSKFALSINGAVTAYTLSLRHPARAAHAATTLFHARALRHQFEGLQTKVTYLGQLVALVGRHHWPYTLLNFTIASPALLTGLSLGQRQPGSRLPPSITGDLQDITVAVRLRWSPTPFLPAGTGAGTKTGSGPDTMTGTGAGTGVGAGATTGAGVGAGAGTGRWPVGYRLRAWDHSHLVAEITTSVNSEDKGCEATVGGLQLDTVYKVSLEAVLPLDQPGPALSFSLDAGALHVGGGGLTTDGVSECYSGLQVRCPGAERCVSPYWICDGAPDCPDGADEVGCEDTPCAGFRCFDDACIARAWRCDGHRDCKDGDDEFACPECRSGEVTCPHGGGCIPHNATCDGAPNCPDGWDESGSVCGPKSCGPRELRCLEGGRCVPHHRLCDGVPDCPEAEDEEPAFCSAFSSVINLRTRTSAAEDLDFTLCQAEKRNCTYQQFRCESGECIHQSYLCNGIMDCNDGGDELFHQCQILSTEAPSIQKHEYDSKEKTDESKTDKIEESDILNLYSDNEYQQCIEDGCMNEYQDPEKTSVHSNTVHESTPTGSSLENLTPSTSTQATPGDAKQDSESGIHVNDRLQPNDTSSVLPTTRAYEGPGQGMGEGIREHDPQHEREEETDTNTLERTDIILDDADVSVEIIVEDPTSLDVDEQDLNLSSSEENLHDITNILDSLATEKDTSNYFDLVTSTVAHDNTDYFLLEESSEDSGSASSTTPVSIHSSSPTFIIDPSKNGEQNRDNNATWNVDIPPLASDVSTTAESLTVSPVLPVIVTQSSTTDSLNIKNNTTMTAITHIGNITNSPIPMPLPEPNEGDVEIPASDVSEAEGTTESSKVTDSPDVHSTPGSSTSISADVEKEGKRPRDPDTFPTNMNIFVTTPLPGSQSVTLSSTVQSPMDVTHSSEHNTHRPSSSTTQAPFTTPLPGGQRVAPSSTVESTLDVTKSSENHTQRPSSTTEVPMTSTSTSAIPSTEPPPHTPAFTTQPANWKDMPEGQKNLTILIAIHSELNESKIPQYIIHGMDGSTYQYEVVSIVDDELSEGKNSTQKNGRGTRPGTGDGTHQYLQGNNISSALNIKSSFIFLGLIILVILIFNCMNYNST